MGDVIPSGERNGTLTSVAGSMRRRGLGEAEILAALEVTNTARCKPPLPNDELERIAGSVARYPPAAPTRDGTGPGEEPEAVKIVTARGLRRGRRAWRRAAGRERPARSLIPEGGDVMFYGDGGASKTTLAHRPRLPPRGRRRLARRTVPKPVRVADRSRPKVRAPLFRRKLRRKLDGWQGSDIGDRLRVLEAPWAEFRFPDADEVAALSASTRSTS